MPGEGLPATLPARPAGRNGDTPKLIAVRNSEAQGRVYAVRLSSALDNNWEALAEMLAHLPPGRPATVKRGHSDMVEGCADSSIGG